MWDKVIEKYPLGSGYKNNIRVCVCVYMYISQPLNILQSNIKSIIKTWKEHGTTTTLPREGLPPKASEQVKMGLGREPIKRPRVTLKEPKRSTAQMGFKKKKKKSVHRTTTEKDVYIF